MKYIKQILTSLMVLCLVFGISAPAFAADTSVCITPFSEWEGDNTEFFTHITLTVTDRDGYPVQGAVYALHKWDGSFVQYLTTDRNGYAETGEIPSETDYYLLEVTAPEGYQPNTERKDIILSESCAPSRIDVTAVYDPITGRIKVIKTDENGNPVTGAGFYIYSNKTGAVVDTIITGADGTAVTADLPYGWYELYEYLVPDGFEGGGYYSEMIRYDGETVELYITNYHLRGDVSVYKTGNDGRVIPGAVFSIYTASGEWAEDITTNGDGYAYSSNLIVGDYYAVEISVPAPYALNTEHHYFTLSYSGQRVYLDIENEVAGQSGKVRIVKTDDSNNLLDGVVFGLYRSWDNMKLAELTTGTDGAAESGLLIPGDYYIVELSGKDGYEFMSEPIYFTVDGSGETVELTVINPKIRIFGKVKVIKTDENGTPLPGVTFGVYCSRGNLLEELTTGADGAAVSGILHDGDYYIMEHTGLPGYVPDTGEHHFSITENGAIVAVEVVNQRIAGGLMVYKTDGGSVPLAGAVFGIFNENNEKISEITTSENGAASYGNLPWGCYYLTELSAPDGYIPLTGVIPFEVRTQGETVEITVVNEKEPIPEPTEGRIKLIKTDSETGERLNGAVFGVYDVSNDVKVCELTTDANGEAVSQQLPQGEYYLKELSAPTGYHVNTDRISVAVIADDTVEITVTNDKTPAPEPIPTEGRIKLIKVDSKTSQRLNSAVFGVYRVSDDVKVCELVTGANGEAVSPMLTQGEYYLKELSAPAGYELSTEKYGVTVTADKTVEIIIKNLKTPDPTPTPQPEPTEGRIRLIKVDSITGNRISGAVFGVYRASDNVKVCEMTTDMSGEAVSPLLPKGDYYLREVKAPSAYELSTDKYGVTVKADSIAVITIANVKTPDLTTEPTEGKIRLIKVDSKTNQRLNGAVFGVYTASSGIKVCELVTDIYGEAVSPLLTEGDYYLREITAPGGYEASTEKHGVTVKADKTVEITVKNVKSSEPVPTTDPTPTPTPNPVPVPAPTTGELLIVKKAEQTGNPLHGAVFGVYKVSSNAKVSELTTNTDGMASLILEPGEYYLKELSAPYGYRLEPAKIYFTVTVGATVKVEVTNIRDTNIPDGGVPGGNITVPKTGMDFPAVSYALAGLLWAVAMLCGVLLYRGRKGKLN